MAFWRKIKKSLLVSRAWGLNCTRIEILIVLWNITVQNVAAEMRYKGR